MRPLTTLTITPGQSVTAGDLRYDDGWVWLNNESSFTLTISTGAGPQTLPAESSDLFVLKLPTGAPSLVITSSAVVPYVGPAVMSVTGQVYSDTEGAILPPRGPVPLARHPALGAQARIVTVPIASKQNFVAQTSIVDGTTIPFSLSGINPNMAAAKSFIAYIYWVQLQLQIFPANVQNHVTAYLEMYPGDVSLAPVGGFTPVVFYQAEIYAAWNSTSFTLYSDCIHFTPAFPIQGGASGWSGSPVNACLRIRTRVYSGTGLWLAYNIGADVDRNNAQDVPGSIGNAVAYGSTGGPNNSDIF